MSVAVVFLYLFDQVHMYKRSLKLCCTYTEFKDISSRLSSMRHGIMDLINLRNVFLNSGHICKIYICNLIILSVSVLALYWPYGEPSICIYWLSVWSWLWQTDHIKLLCGGHDEHKALPIDRCLRRTAMITKAVRHIFLMRQVYLSDNYSLVTVMVMTTLLKLRQFFLWPWL